MLRSDKVADIRCFESGVVNHAGEAAERLNRLRAVLPGSRAQWAAALGVTDVDLASASRIATLDAITAAWTTRHSRPLGMILPKPRVEIDALWTELARPHIDERIVVGLLDQLALRHSAFEVHMHQRASRASADPEAGMLGLFAPRPEYSDREAAGASCDVSTPRAGQAGPAN